MQLYKYTGSLYITFPSAAACKPVNKCYSVESCSFLWGTTRCHHDKPALWLKYLPLEGGTMRLQFLPGLEGIWILLSRTSWGCKFFGLGHLAPLPLPIEERHHFLGSPLCPGLQRLTPGPTPKAGDGQPVTLAQWVPGCAPGFPWGVNRLTWRLSILLFPEATWLCSGRVWLPRCS